MAADDLLDSASDAPGPETTPSGPSFFVLALVVTVGAVAGGWLGGPVLAPTMKQVLAAVPWGGGGSHGDDGHGASGEEEGEGLPTIDNLILNPANSGGSRFLIATLVLDADAAAGAEIARRDAEVRDHLLTVLSAHTVEELSDIAFRDRIRDELRVALNSLLGRDGVRRIFLPQFVIQ